MARLAFTAWPIGHALFRLDDAVVDLGPGLGLVRIEEREGQRADAVLAAATLIVSRLVQAIHMGGCGFCIGLGTMLRQGNEKPRPLVAGVGLHRHHVGDLLGGLQRQGPLLACAGIREAAQLEAGGPLADAEVEAAVAHDVQGRRGPRRCGRDGCSWGSPGGCRGPGGCSWSGRRRRPGTPRAPRSASTPPGSGARPPTRSRSPGGRPAGPAPARRGTAWPRRRDSRAWAAGARRRSRSAWSFLPPPGCSRRSWPAHSGRAPRGRQAVPPLHGEGQARAPGSRWGHNAMRLSH